MIGRKQLRLRADAIAGPRPRHLKRRGPTPRRARSALFLALLAVAWLRSPRRSRERTDRSVGAQRAGTLRPVSLGGAVQEPAASVLAVRGVRRGAAALDAVAADGRDAGALPIHVDVKTDFHARRFLRA